MFFAISLVFFCALAIAGFAITASFKEREESEIQRKRRLGSQTGLPFEDTGKTVKVSPVKDLRLSSIRAFNDFLARRSVVANVARLMRQAGMNRRVGEVLLYMPLLGAIGALVGLVGFGNPGLGVVLGVVFAYLPIAFIRRMRTKRLSLFAEQLPDALDLVRAALQAGHSFGVALKVVAEEFPDPVATEFDTIAEEMKLGLPLRDALLGLQDRVDDPNVPVLVVGVLVVQESGGNLAEVLGNVSHTVRERFKLLRDVEVMTAQGKLSGGMLTVLPIGVGTMLYVIAPEYFDAMFAEPTGHYMLAYAAVSILVGHLIIQRIVKIKV